MLKIKSVDLVRIAIAAEIWFKKQNEIYNCFENEINTATTLKETLKWNDAELFIDEVPF